MATQEQLQQYEEKSKKAAYLVVKALRIFKDEPIHIRQQAQHIIMQRVQSMLHGTKEVLDGAGLVTEPLVSAADK